MKLQDTLASIGNKAGGWRKLIQIWERGRGTDGPVRTPLREVHGFGSNPGNLRMFRYLPPKLAENPALVVVLHGCTQTAAGYDLGAGWSTLADRYGFALLFPEQQRINNPNGCFNWFQPEDSQRDRGEPLSIRQMIEKSVVDHGIDRRRVFVTGLSAGGAMTSIMLACYPDLFAGGAIVAGLPYGAASNVQQAFESMFQSPSRPAREWGDLARKASSHQGAWPRVSVWHGNVDKTVIPSNAREILKQWTDIHGLSIVPSAQTRVDGYPRDVWMNEAGDEILESYTITNMAHGTPLAIGGVEGACGAAGPFLLPVGISSSYHISKFFGIANAHLRQRTPAETESLMLRLSPAGARHEELAGPVLDGEVLDKEDEPKLQQEPRPSFPEIGAVIHKALKAAGLTRD
jgi:poly(hydroxyalkanoate) depolymerase family esterase